MHTLGELSAGLGTYASAINDSGKMVGYGGVVSGGQRAIIWNGTTAYDLNTMLGATPTGWVLSQAYGINNSGQITGMGTINGQTHAFLMTPNSRRDKNRSYGLLRPIGPIFRLVVI